MSDGFSELVRNSARGSLFLFAGQIISAIISAITVIFIARYIGAESYGEYTLTLVPFNIANLVTDFGISTAITRFCAMYRKEGKTNDLKAVVRIGMVFTLIVTLVFSIALYLTSNIIASTFMQRPDLEYLAKVASWSVLGNGLMISAMAVLVGYEKMWLRSSTLIFYSIVRGAIGVVLVLAGLGSFGQVIAYSASNIVAGSVATIFLIIFIKYEKNPVSQSDVELFKRMMFFGAPVYMKSLVITGLNQLYQILMVIYVSAELIGNYGAAKNFGVLVAFLTIPIGTVLFPLFSKYKKSDPQIRTLYFKSVKYTTIVTLPIIACLILVSKPLGEILFGSGYSYLPLYLSLFILSYSFEGLGGTTQEYLILGIGEARVSFIAGVITFVAGAALSFVLIPQYHIVGLLVSSMIAPRAGWVYSTYWLKKNLGFTADWSISLRIYGAAFVAFALSFIVLQLINLKGWVMLIVGSGIFFSLYILALPLLGVLDHGALRELNEVANVFGPFAWIPKTLISWVKRLVR